MFPNVETIHVPCIAETAVMQLSEKLSNMHGTFKEMEIRRKPEITN